MTLGEFIQRYRSEHDISQRQFAHICGLSHSYISMIERGVNPRSDKPIVPTIGQMKKLADGMGTTMMELFEQIDDMPIDINTEAAALIGQGASAPANEEGRAESIDIEIASLILRLSPEKKKEAVRYLRYLAESAEE